MSMIINPYVFGTSGGGGGGSIPSSTKIIHLETDVAGMVLNGSNVREWPDQSGFNNKAFQYSTSYQPLFINPSSEMNGLPAIGFTAAVDQGLFVASSSSLDISANGFTMYMIIDIDAYPSTVSAFIQHSNDVVWTQGWGIIYINNNLRFWVNNWNNTANYIELPAPPINQRLMIKFRWDKSTMTAFYRRSGTSTTGSKAFTGPYINPGYAMGIMKPTGGSQIYEAQGKLGAVFLYGSGLSTTDQNTIETYLQTKYGIS